MPTLYLTEKPDQGRKIAGAIGVASKADGHIVCKDGSLVTWCFGHLLETAMPEEYDEALKPWRWETLPFIPAPFRFRPKNGGAAKQIKVIASLLKKATDVVVATDADREGEMIAWEVLVHLKYQGNPRRLWIADLTPEGIRKGLAALRDGAETKPLYFAALARCCADFMVGINMTRGVTIKLRAPEKGARPFSIGRVQTPTLALVVRLERKIRNFKPEAYYELLAHVDTATGKQVKMRFAPPPEKRIMDADRIERGRAQAEGQSGPIQRQTTPKKTAPPELYSLTKLQGDCNSRYGFSADKTLKLAQELYEKAVLTYPRTDGTVLFEEHQERIPQILSNLLALPDLKPLSGELAKPIVRKRHYDDAKAGKASHHAIVPTLKPCDLADLTDEQAKVYLLVARSYLAAHMADYEYLATSMILKAGGVPFRVGGSVPTALGWKMAFKGVPEETQESSEEDESDQGELPDIKDGEIGTATKVETVKKMTKEPTRFTEKTLLAAMENVAKYVEDEAARKRLKETSGLGTVATRAAILETLKQRKFIETKKKKLVPTDSGMGLIAALETALPSYADPVQTALWEDYLEQIAAGKASTKDFIGHIAGQIKRDVAHLKGANDLPMFSASGQQVDRKAAMAARPKGNGSDWAKRREETIAKGRPLKVPYEKREEAKSLGAIWNPDKKAWMIHPDTDPAPFVERGWLGADQES
ncbi:DNA topoisomerase 3 [Rhodovibrio sodomensis]|nr:DNA topoisomerase 3 [Rhodovibrio sodomensis]